MPSLLQETFLMLSLLLSGAHKNTSHIFMKLIQQNLIPLAFVILATCIGYFFNSTLDGAVVGLALVCIITLIAELSE